MELLFKWYSARSLIEALKQSKDGAVWRLTLSRTTEPYFLAVLEYLYSVGDKNQSVDELKEVLNRLLPEKREAIMNFAQQLEQRGEQRGYQRALQATHSEAWRASKIEDAREMLVAKLDIELIKRITRLTEDDLEGLQEVS
jgi:hypothetical protein